MKNVYSIRFPSIDTVNNDGFFAVVNPNEDHDSAKSKLAFFGDDALIKKLASQAEMNFVYSLVCHDPVENEDMNLLTDDDRSLMLRIMNHRRNIDGDFYAYHIEVRSGINATEALRHTDDVARLHLPVEGVPVAAVDCSDDLPF